MIDKNEAKLIAIMLGFSLLWNFLIIPFIVITDQFYSLYPFYQYILFNTGWIIMFTLVFGIPVSVLKRQDVQITEMLLSGIGVFLLFSMVFDVLLPPFSYGFDGSVLVSPTKENVASTSVDYALGRAYVDLGVPLQGDVFGLKYSLVWMLIYIFTPVMAFVFGALLLAGNSFMNLVKQGA